MEADDDLVPEPNSRGYLDLTNRAWVNLDPAGECVNICVCMFICSLYVAYFELITVRVKQENAAREILYKSYA